MFEVDALYSAVTRWRLGFATANEAAAVLVCLLPVAWLLGMASSVCNRESRFVRQFWRALAFVASGLLWYTLARTGSRGGCIAALFEAVVYAIWMRISQTAPSWRVCSSVEMRWLFVQFILAAGSLLASGEVGRVSPWFSAADRSVLNRGVLWRGGIELAADAPVSGWGAGEAGSAFMNWTQPLDRSERYSTMVNSFLHLAVERGLLWFAIIIAGVAFLVLSPISLLPTRGIKPAAVFSDASPLGPEGTSFGWWDVAAFASCVWTGWGVGNVFSTLWIEVRLWILPDFAALAGILAVLCGGSGRRSLGIAGLALCFGALAAGLLWTTGRFIAWKRPWLLENLAPGVVSLKVRVDERMGRRRAEFVVWTDKTVFGDTPGKEMRRWMEDRSGPRRITACDPRLAGDADVIISEKAAWVLVGDQCWRLVFAPADAEVVLLHPRGLPPEATRKDLILVLPELDQEGTNPIWQSWAKASGNRIVYSAQSGEDIRPAWPGVIAKVNE